MTLGSLGDRLVGNGIEIAPCSLLVALVEGNRRCPGKEGNGTRAVQSKDFLLHGYRKTHRFLIACVVRLQLIFVLFWALF